MDARSERPARWHGPTPSLREGNPTERPARWHGPTPSLLRACQNGTGEQGRLGTMPVFVGFLTAFWIVGRRGTRIAFSLGNP